MHIYHKIVAIILYICGIVSLTVATITAFYLKSLLFTGDKLVYQAYAAFWLLLGLLMISAAHIILLLRSLAMSK